jgi:hypothetical protein
VPSRCPAVLHSATDCLPCSRTSSDTVQL